MKILAGLDFGDASLEALRQARALAHATSGSLAACYVLPAVHDLAALFPAQSIGVPSGTLADDGPTRETLIAHVRVKLGIELNEVFVERGAAYAELVRRAEQIGADLIAVGSHGRTGLARLMLGSVAERVVRHAHCSVLVARAAEKTGVVLAATDLSPPSLSAVTAAAATAQRTGARLVLVSVLDWADTAPGAAAALIGVAPVQIPEEVRQQVRASLATMLVDTLARTGAPGETRVVEGEAANAIVTCAEELGAELVVVGTHGRTGLRRLALGSVAERVVRNASCSVLTVR
jgi:nucleotide-binding universal stress UspA family protein